jgi:hypothetical protein
MDTESDPQLRKEIVRISQSDSRLASTLEGRSQILFAVEKPLDRRTKEQVNQTLIGIYDYDRNDSVLAVIDTDSKTVVDVQTTPAQFQLSNEERSEAEQIAGADNVVQSFLAGRKMNPLTRLYFPTGSHPANHRYAIVFIRPSKSERWYAIVDLTTRSIVDIVSRRRLAGE